MVKNTWNSGKIGTAHLGIESETLYDDIITEKWHFEKKWFFECFEK